MATSLSAHAPRAKDLSRIFLVAVGLRVLLCLLTMWVDDISFTRFVEYIDGPHYLTYAEGWLAGINTEASAYELRLFPGYPALIALLHLAGIPLHFAAVVPNWLAPGFIALLSALMFNDRRVGWAMAVLTPSFLLNSVLVSTEPWCLMLTMIGLTVARRGHHVAGGAVFGLAGFIRPMACFALLAFILVRWSQRRWKQGLLCGVTAAVVFVAGMGAVAWRFGDPLLSVRGYTHEKAHGDHMFSWPFESLVMTPTRQQIAHQTDPENNPPAPPTWKIAFIWAHVIVVLVGCALALVRCFSEREELDHLHLLAALWLWLNTLFVLCIGSDWGFNSFDRFILPALPPLLFSYQHVLPRKTWVWLVIAVLSLLLALQATARGSLPARLKQLTGVSPASSLSRAARPDAPGARRDRRPVLTASHGDWTISLTTAPERCPSG